MHQDGRVPELSERELAPLNAVAAEAGATRCEAGGDGPDAYLTIGTRRIAVDVATVRSPRAAQNAPPRLLFDRVARRFIDELRATLGDVAGHRLVIVTHTAPIRMPGRTGAELAQKVFDLLQSTTAGVDASAAICGNDIRIRILDGHRVDRGAVVVFIHNPKTDPAVLLDVSESLLEARRWAVQGAGSCSSTPTRRPRSSRTGACSTNSPPRWSSSES